MSIYIVSSPRVQITPVTGVSGQIEMWTLINNCFNKIFVELRELHDVNGNIIMEQAREC